MYSQVEERGALIGLKQMIAWLQSWYGKNGRGRRLHTLDIEYIVVQNRGWVICCMIFTLLKALYSDPAYSV